MAGLGDRPTSELILLILTGLVAVTVVLVGGGVVTLALIHPEHDYTPVLTGLGSLVGALAGAVVGYLAGRGQRQEE